MGLLYRISDVADPSWVRDGDGAEQQPPSACHNDFVVSVEDDDFAFDIIEDIKVSLDTLKANKLENAEGQGDVDNLINWLKYIRDRVDEMAEAV